jgi:uncharacterized protein
VAGTSLLTLLDDIATLLDDVAAMTKVATKKTAGVLGDDLALNAEQVSGVNPERELPVVWAVARGSAKNKAILVPAALMISAFAPWAITPLLMVGGAYLSYEGAEKVLHKLVPHDEREETEHHEQAVRALVDPTVDVLALEKERVRGAVRTDFILSAEIIVISLGAVGTAPLLTRIMSLCAIAVLMTVGVYALVGGIVKLDDAGVALRAKRSRVARAIGAGILRTAPYLMKALSIAGTVAMFLVGGGILAHGIPGVEKRMHDVVAALGPFAGVATTLAHAIVGIVLGALIVGVVALLRRARTPGPRTSMT